MGAAWHESFPPRSHARTNRFEPFPALRRRIWVGAERNVAHAFAPRNAAYLLKISVKRGVELFTVSRDWLDNFSSTGESAMSATASRRRYGAVLFVGFLITMPIVPASAQSLTYSQTDPNAPVYQFTPEADRLPSPALQRQVVPYAGNEQPGTVIIDPAHTYLYLTLGDGRAMRYGIGVGREGFEWSGVERIARKAEWPDWIPPAAMVARQPYLPRWVAGGPGNPLGARALYLGGTDYRIHGTNDPSSIGKHMSSGCIRLLNADVIDLYNRVNVGAKVIVLPDTQSRPIRDAQTDVNLPATPAPRAAESSLARTVSRSDARLTGIY
jgi:lipoprotein-anchoring transpeptidase ErfK/SrfK